MKGMRRGSQTRPQGRNHCSPLPPRRRGSRDPAGLAQDNCPLGQRGQAPLHEDPRRSPPLPRGRDPRVGHGASRRAHRVGVGPDRWCRGRRRPCRPTAAWSARPPSRPDRCQRDHQRNQDVRGELKPAAVVPEPHLLGGVVVASGRVGLLTRRAEDVIGGGVLEVGLDQLLASEVEMAASQPELKPAGITMTPPTSSRGGAGRGEGRGPTQASKAIKLRRRHALGDRPST